MTFYKRFFKRFVDILLSSIAIVVFSPVFLFLAIAIKMTSPGPVFFKQKRVGIHKTYFNILKFRTMRTDTPHDTPTHLLETPDVWITGVGRFLRKTSLDELPQILQIFTGRMSIIGPRPALWNQEDLLDERDKYGANDIRPGLTGWAQINGRDELPIAVKAGFDGEYMEKISFLFDLKCLVKTIRLVVKKDGIVEGNTGTVSYEILREQVSEDPQNISPENFTHHSKEKNIITLNEGREPEKPDGFFAPDDESIIPDEELIEENPKEKKEAALKE